MKAFISIAVAAIIFSSCSTAYQSGQTPDDVYYSPQRPQASQNEYVNVEQNNSNRYQYNNDENNSDEYSYDDEYLRMKVRNRARWSMLDNDFYFYNASPFAYYTPYSYNPYAYRYYGDVYYNHFGLYNPYGMYNNFGLGLGLSYNPYYNPYYANPYYSHYGSYYYNPYGAPIIVGKNRTPVYSSPRTSNLNIYNRSNRNTRSRQGGYIEQGNNNQRPVYNNNSSRRNSGNDLRNVFGNNNSSNNTPSRPSVNTNSNSSSNSGSSSRGSSGGNAPVRRF